jgi:hypothetical protein
VSDPTPQTWIECKRLIKIDFYGKALCENYQGTRAIESLMSANAFANT